MTQGGIIANVTATATEEHPQASRTPEVFMSKAEVARYLGLGPRSLSRVRLPRADARIGPYKGWRRTTIDNWNLHERPGRGNWGSRRNH